MHTIHLPCGEMTVTLEDFAMITTLPLQERALCGRVDMDNWRGRVVALIVSTVPLSVMRPTMWWITEHLVYHPYGSIQPVQMPARCRRVDRGVVHEGLLVVLSDRGCVSILLGGHYPMDVSGLPG